MRRLLHVVLAAALTWGCSRPSSRVGEKLAADGGPDAGGAVDGGIPSSRPIAEVEPNDSPETAQHIDREATVLGRIDAVQPATKPDEDWYLIQPAELPQDMKVELSYARPLAAEPPTGKFVLEVYDRDHNRLQAQSGPLARPPGSDDMMHAFPLADLPPLRVRDGLLVRVAGHQAVFPYLLAVVLSHPDPNSEAEPNDRAVDATALPFDHPTHGSYGTEDDKDYYVIELAPDAGAPTANPTPIPAPTPVPNPTPAPAPAPNPTLTQPTEMLRVDVTGTGARQSLTILDDTQTPLGTFKSHDTAEPLAVRDFALRPGLSRLFLLLEAIHPRKPATNSPFVPLPYAITVHREPAPPDLELEPNDTLELATPLVSSAASPSMHRVGFLSPVGDVDDYRLHLDAPARVHVTLSALDHVDSELSIVEPDASNAAGKTVLKINEGGAKEPEVIPAITLGAGDHFLRVQAAAHKVGDKWVRDQEDPEQTYRLEVEVAPDDGSFEREPNDTAASATPILPGQTLSGFAFPARDVDVYRLDLSAEPVAAGVSFRLTGVPRLPLALELRENQGGSLGGLLNSADPGKPGADAQLQQKLDPGVYFLVVKAHPASRSAGVPQSDPDTPYKLTVQIQ